MSLLSDVVPVIDRKVRPRRTLPEAMASTDRKERVMAGHSGAPGRSVTSRALAVLDAFDATAPRLSLSEIAERSGTPLTTAHRLLAELTAWGALTRRGDGRYEIGRKLWDLGLLAPVQLELRQVASPFLLDIHTATRETVHLAVRDDVKALYVERISGRESVPVVSQVGSRLPLHATGVGKALLAFAPPDVVERALGRPSRETRHTIVDPERLRRELAEIRRRGYARTAEEMSLGASSAAVPIRVDGAVSSTVVGALGVVVPSHRRDLLRLVPVLEVAARGIGRELARAAGAAPVYS
jgi:DNA-binding IclR family transcriptional regulator